MARINPHTIRLQVTRMFQEGQSFFATIKVQDWLRERQQDPAEYEILFHRKPAPPGSREVMTVDIELRRHDGKPVEAWLQEELNLTA